ncbi:hypothetical protein CTAYLR_002255 [Chrysophaeum taylorii]|uniref:Cyclin N-terminal domain-containing protein n=1 Tax=Chrysophaeum taylorii TaxID=2483200 RepID=A0AAD7UMZ9_9STRA|nr:hypothetical protein CTAYLR_002255 [Chrysophaeum taylorii]
MVSSPVTTISQRVMARGGEPKVVPAARDSGDQKAQLVYDGGSRGQVYAELERPQPSIPEEEEKTSGTRAVASSAESPDPRFVLTHEVASPALPRRVHYRTPINRLSTRRYEAVGSSEGSVAKPDHDDCLRRTAVVVHKHVATCEAREARARALRKPRSLDVQFRAEAREARALRKPRSLDVQFRAEASRVFHETNYATPRFDLSTYRLPLAWTGFQYSMRKVREHYFSPSMEDVYDFLSTLFVRAHLSSECSIVCLIYVERLMDKGQVSLLAATWRPVLLCSMLLASKVWQDCASWNIEFSVVYPEYSLASINLLERNFVAALGWDMYISQSLYAKFEPRVPYYFALRSLNEKHDFRRRYNHFVIRTTNEKPEGAINVQRRSDKLSSDWSKVLSKSL